MLSMCMLCNIKQCQKCIFQVFRRCAKSNVNFYLIYMIPSSYQRACRALHQVTWFLHHIKGLADHYTKLHDSFIISKGLQSTTPSYMIPSSYQRACRALHQVTWFLHHIKGLAEHYTKLHDSFIISKGLQSTTPSYMIPSSYQRACRALHQVTWFLHHIKGLAEHYTNFLK